jgi:hypothetical protein
MKLKARQVIMCFLGSPSLNSRRSAEVISPISVDIEFLISLFSFHTVTCLSTGSSHTSFPPPFFLIPRSFLTLFLPHSILYSISISSFFLPTTAVSPFPDPSPNLFPLIRSPSHFDVLSSRPFTLPVPPLPSLNLTSSRPLVRFILQPPLYF